MLRNKEALFHQIMDQLNNLLEINFEGGKLNYKKLKLHRDN